MNYFEYNERRAVPKAAAVEVIEWEPPAADAVQAVRDAFKGDGIVVIEHEVPR